MIGALISGLIMGLASSLHCAGMCGPIGCVLLRSNTTLDATLALVTAQAGKLVSYTLLGAAFGIFGSGLYGVLNLQVAHSVLQWSASLTILWMALATAGLVPAMAGLDRVFAPAASALAQARSRWIGSGYGGLAVAGVLWGAMPCAMVYMALFNSLIAGSWFNGAAMMSAFALGTLPAVTLSSFGLFRMSRLTARPAGRWWAGAALGGSGVLGLLLTVPGSPLCIG
jgi:sulfite exporter TauE/SafE